MHLVQLLLPLGAEQSAVSQIRAELTERFGGITVYSRNPAEGFWRDGPDEPVTDDIVVVEVMAAIWDPVWWRSYRARLERRLGEAEVVIRALPMERV
ncbi:MAG: hypothetical protein IT534_12800 [Bauldia sp.]|nr:hypothetical protein [Bauldia sp.]